MEWDKSNISRLTYVVYGPPPTSGTRDALNELGIERGCKNLSRRRKKNLKEFDARVDAQREQVKVSLKQAIEANDSQKIMEANDALTKLAVEKEKARLEMENREQQQQQKQNVEAKPKENSFWATSDHA